MSEYRERFLEAHSQGILIKTALETSHKYNYREGVIATLIELHNDQKIDVVAQFNQLKNIPDTGINFFEAKRLLEKTLPSLNVDAPAVIRCVQHIAAESNGDASVGMMYSSFIEYCAKNKARPQEALEFIENNSSEHHPFLLAVLIAGSKIDIDLYFSESIRLSRHASPEIRANAIAALGRIQYPQASPLTPKAFGQLKAIVNQEDNDVCLAATIQTILSLPSIPQASTEALCKLLQSALAKGAQQCVLAVLDFFAFPTNDIELPILDVILPYLHQIDFQHAQAVERIDFGISKIFEQDTTRGIEILESFLLASQNDLRIESLGSTRYVILDSQKHLLSKLLTRWFLSGEPALCNAIRELIHSIHGHEIQLEIDLNELPSTDIDKLIFLSRKAIGYLFFKPITATSIVLSALRHLQNEDSLPHFSSLLFDQLLVNYPGKISKFLEERLPLELGLAKTGIQVALTKYAEYSKNLTAVGEIKELQPSQEQQDIQLWRMRELMRKSNQDAYKNSLAGKLFHTSVILYGRKTISYVQDPSGKRHRLVNKMGTISASMDIARNSYLDPFGLEYMLFVFRSEKLKHS